MVFWIKFGDSLALGRNLADNVFSQSGDSCLCPTLSGKRLALASHTPNDPSSLHSRHQRAYLLSGKTERIPDLIIDYVHHVL